MKILILIALLFFAGCSLKSLHVNEKDLETLLLKHGMSEAKKLAKEAFFVSKKLKKEYDFSTSPQFHNFLVNARIKQRGLCWHFAYDMLEYFKSKNFKDVDYYIATANRGDYWEEHNVLVLTCKECKIEKGIILDAWRDTNELFYAPFMGDPLYNWKKRGDKR